MKRSTAAIIGLVLAALTLVVAPASAATPFCGIHWGSLAKSAPDNSTAPLTNIRAGRHACYDRIVLDVAGSAAGYTALYVNDVVQEGSGATIPVRGGARLQITANNPAYDFTTAAASYSPANTSELADVTRFRTLRQLVWAGTFEGYSSIGIGVRAQLPFRVFELAGPGSTSRIVIDVAHRW